MKLVNEYNQHSAAHRYFVGFEYDAKLYLTDVRGHLPETMLKEDRAAASKGGMLKIRVRLGAKLKAMLINSNRAVQLGTIDLLNTDDKYNKGERFERLVTERYTGKKWEKDSVPFWQAGDIELNGEQIQIKFEGAELTNERTMARLQAAMA